MEVRKDVGRIVVGSVPSKVQNLRKMSYFGQNFSIFAHCYNDLKAN